MATGQQPAPEPRGPANPSRAPARPEPPGPVAARGRRNEVDPAVVSSDEEAAAAAHAEAGGRPPAADRSVAPEERPVAAAEAGRPDAAGAHGQAPRQAAQAAASDSRRATRPDVLAADRAVAEVVGGAEVEGEAVDDRLAGDVRGVVRAVPGPAADVVDVGRAVEAPGEQAVEGVRAPPQVAVEPGKRVVRAHHRAVAAAGARRELGEVEVRRGPEGHL